MARSRLDQVVETYVKTILKDEEKANLSSITNISEAVKADIVSDLRSKEIRQMKEDVKAEADRYMQNVIAEAEGHKKRIIKKAEKGLIYEAIFIAFLVGMIVNQVTYLIPASGFWAGVIIIVALLVCVLLIRAETGKD